ncbi:hypothetical protein BaRGS_00037877 [Batillaria attramentaria]|uniref:Uncharacterized protein n=1 Tax=Batillaria attramentaria TaxID=370345 RepID=A0ABD0J7K6_9CAEN
MTNRKPAGPKSTVYGRLLWPRAKADDVQRVLISMFAQTVKKECRSRGWFMGRERNAMKWVAKMYGRYIAVLAWIQD